MPTPRERQTRRLLAARTAIAVVVGRAVIGPDTPVITELAEVRHGQLVRVRDTQNGMRTQRRVRVVMHEPAEMRGAEVLIVLGVHQEFVPALVDSVRRRQRFARDCAQVQVALGVGEQLAGLFVGQVKLALHRL